jgi:hypothetical protein
MPRLFNPIRAFVHLRVIVAGACVLTGAALTFVATASNDSSDPTAKKAVSNTLSHNLIAGAKEGSAKKGQKISPTTAAEEEYAHRAYPGPNEIDLRALINAQRGFLGLLSAPPPSPTPAPSPSATATPRPSATATPRPSATATPRPSATATPKSTATPPPIMGSGSAVTTSGSSLIKGRPLPEGPPPINFWQEVTGNTEVNPNVLTFTGSNTNASGRITALALDTHNPCTAAFCRVWVAAAGGGIWRTTNALAVSPAWTPVSIGVTGCATPLCGFATNAIGAMTFFDDTTANGQLFVGTGEPNTSGDSQAGIGIYKSVDGGVTWTLLPSQIGPITTISPGSAVPFNGTYTGSAFLSRSISEISVSNGGNTLYVASARGIRGIDATQQAGTTNPTTPRPPYGVFKSTDGGNTFSYIFDGDPSCGPGTCLGAGPLSSVRGATQVELDPNNPNIVYASVFPSNFGLGGGVWRSNDGGSTWVQIKTALNAAFNFDRCTFSTTTGGAVGANTRMYVGCGNGVAPAAQVYRSDLVQIGAPVFTNLSALEIVPSTTGYCDPQCSYDNVVYTPQQSAQGPFFPDVVYAAGVYQYSECGFGSDCRGVVVAYDAGASGFWNDDTWDAQNNGPAGSIPFGGCCQPNLITPNGSHTDMHALFTVPGNPTQFFLGSDGGIVQSNGVLTDISSQCLTRTYPAGTGTLLQCEVLLGFFGINNGVPNFIDTTMNSGLRTMQIQQVSIAPDNPVHFQFGTQDNGTQDGTGIFVNYSNVMFGDGGQGGFNAATSLDRVNTFTFQQSAASFHNGAPTTWDLITGPILASPEGSYFYPPVYPDPVVGGTIFHGDNHVWRTQDWGGNPVVLDATCNVFGATPLTCGDFVPLGGAAGTNDQGCLTCAFWGNRAGGFVSVIQRPTSNANTVWASTGTGRLFVSDNGNAPAAAVVWNRVDDGFTATPKSPGRFITGIAVDPVNPHRAFVSYSGYNFNTPAQPGHVFMATWNGVPGVAATITDLTRNYFDAPATAIAYDPATLNPFTGRGDLYMGNDFVVLRLDANPTTNPGQAWFAAGVNMPMQDIASLALVPVPGTTGLLYAGTHGRGLWVLPLP